MKSSKFAEEIFEFLKAHDPHRYCQNTEAVDGIAEIEAYLSDPSMIRETIRDIEQISDSFVSHGVYVSEVKPLLEGLREAEKKLETEQSRRMVGDTGYEVRHAIHVGDKEIVFAEDKCAENGLCFFVGNYTSNDIVGQYADCQISEDFLEIMQEFTGRVNVQIEAMKEEISRSRMPHTVFTAEQCHRNDYGQSIVGKVVAIKADILRPEYRRGDVQLVLVGGASGAKANPSGHSVFCYHLNDGQHTRFERHDVQGEVKPEFLPVWASQKAAVLRAKENIARPGRTKKDKGNAR